MPTLLTGVSVATDKQQAWLQYKYRLCLNPDIPGRIVQGVVRYAHLISLFHLEKLKGYCH
jgi:hypothetical protein